MKNTGLFIKVYEFVQFLKTAIQEQADYFLEKEQAEYFLKRENYA